MPKRVLIVDDDTSITSILSYAFNNKGYDVIASNTGADAKTLAIEKRPDMIILDVLLPGEGGLALLKEFRDSDELKKTPIIMISGVYKSYDIIKDTLAKGANDYFKKPFDLERLVGRVESLCPLDPEEKKEEKKERVMSKYLFVEKIPDSSEFSVIPPYKVFATYYTQKRSGVLTLKDKSVTKKIMLKDGSPIEVSSNIAGEWLGRLLVREGAITAEQYKDTLEIMQNEKKRHGEILLSEGLLKPADLYKFLKMQLVEKITNTFNWTEGVYDFAPDTELDRVSPKQTDLPRLVYDGIREKVDKDFVKSELSELSEMSVFTVKDKAAVSESFAFTGEEQKLLNRFDGISMLSSVKENGSDGNELFDYMLYVLMIFNALKLVGEASGLYEDIEKASTHAPKSTEPMTDEEEKSVAMISDLFNKLSEMSYYDLFDIEKGDDTAVIKKAYFKLAKDLHPDKLAAQKFDYIRGRAGKVFSEVANAYQTLTDDDLREQYDKKLSGEGADSEEMKDAHNILTAEMQFQKGLAYLHSKDYKKACESFDWAIKLNQKEAEYHLYRAVAIFKDPNKEAAESRIEAKNIIQDVNSMNPNLPEAHYYLGMIYKLDDDVRSAEQSFQKTLRLDRDHAEASRELRLIRMRKEKEEKKGFLKGFFK